MFNAVNILEALKNYIRTHGGTSNAYNIAEAVNDLNSIPQSSGGDIPPEVSNAIETHGLGWTDEEEVEGFDITWNGDIEGLDDVGCALYKVISEVDDIVSKDDLIGAKIEVVGIVEIPSPYTLSADNILIDDGKVIGCSVDGLSLVVAIEDGEGSSAQFTKGVWFSKAIDGGYISRLYKEATTEEVVHQIDQKYIPQSSGGGMVVNLTFVDFNTPIRADKTLLELAEAFSNGIPVIAKLYAENQLLISAQCVECEDPYEACGMCFGSSIYHSEGSYTDHAIMGTRKLDDDEETIIDFWECTILA